MPAVGNRLLRVGTQTECQILVSLRSDQSYCRIVCASRILPVAIIMITASFDIGRSELMR
jgi:hypothetical protein